MFILPKQISYNGEIVSSQMFKLYYDFKNKIRTLYCPSSFIMQIPLKHKWIYIKPECSTSNSSSLHSRDVPVDRINLWQYLTISSFSLWVCWSDLLCYQHLHLPQSGLFSSSFRPEERITWKAKGSCSQLWSSSQQCKFHGSHPPCRWSQAFLKFRNIVFRRAIEPQVNDKLKIIKLLSYLLISINLKSESTCQGTQWQTLSIKMD